MVATRFIPSGTLILAERPLLARQTLENRRYNPVCENCHAFLGRPQSYLRHRVAIGMMIVDDDDGDRKKKNRDRMIDTVPIPTGAVPCRHRCGYWYCSNHCETDCWDLHHQHLCTGRCQTMDHPLVTFKQYCIETNEILLAVAEWWISQHLAEEEDTVAYTNFTMTPWWEVVTAEVAQALGGDESAAVTLEQQLRDVCQEAAERLNAVIGFRSNTNDQNCIPQVTALDIAQRMGAFEQNCVGITQRHPMCREIFEQTVRETCHIELVRCLEQAGLIGAECDKEDSSCDEKEDGSASDTEQQNDWDYSVDEIASFLASLRIDEDGSVRDVFGQQPDDDDDDDQQEEELHEFDDLDDLFPPLDGTAMYSIACKMNHSCDPNVVLIYKRRAGWGQCHPLTAYCVALRDISEGDELTISYINSNESYEKRQESLVNYGFVCECEKCISEKLGDKMCQPVHHQCNGDTLGDLFSDDESNTESDSIEQDSLTDGESQLQKVLSRLDGAANHSKYGAIPADCLGAGLAFVSQIARRQESSTDPTTETLLTQCLFALQARDFCLCKIVGCDLEAYLYGMLQRNGEFQSIHFREAYWCAALTASVGLVYDYDFVTAQRLVDKAIILGLPGSHGPLAKLLHYVEVHAGQVFTGYFAKKTALVQHFIVSGASSAARLTLQRGLSQPLRHPIQEMSNIPSFEKFKESFFSTSTPVVLRGFATGWAAVTKWNDLNCFVRRHGSRLVPVELGSMLSGTLEEKLMTMRDFAENYLIPSSAKVWTLEDCRTRSSEVGYMAQHPLLDQIQVLKADIDESPTLCGPAGPQHINVWLGTGGTRTPLHFDSYDNLFVQLVGAKYVRLYDTDQTPNLYVGERSAFGLQGNMSDLDCEQEDWKKHSKAEHVPFTEVLLLPGDCLYIPSRMWHYVRSLSTSISVNYWC